MTKYLDNIDIPCISDESKLLCDLPLTITEIEKAIKCMANNKTLVLMEFLWSSIKFFGLKLIAWFMKAFKKHMNLGNFQIVKDREL